MNEVEGQRKNEKEGKGRSVVGRERWVEGGGKEEGKKEGWKQSVQDGVREGGKWEGRWARVGSGVKGGLA